MSTQLTSSMDPILNDALLAQYRSRKSGLLGRLIEAFLTESPDLFQNVRKAVEGRDFDMMRMSAHTLKSGSHNLGAARLASVCQDIENAAIDKDHDMVEHLLEKLGPEYFEAEQALRGEMAREQGMLEFSATA